MRYSSQQVFAIGIEVTVESEFIAGDKVTAVATGLDHEAGQRFLLHANFGSSLTVRRMYFAEIRRFDRHPPLSTPSKRWA